MTDAVTDLLRVYAPDELRADGYPRAWPQINKLIVEQAGARCERCGHPYRKGEHGSGEWSPCDERCTHGGPVRIDDPEHGDINARLIIEAKWRILTVHHLTGHWSNTRAAKADCRWWNLSALCQRCHLQIQGKVIMDHPWPWEHTEWMRPHAAAFYAWKYLGIDLDRDETDARLDELLALGKRMDAVERMPL